MRRLRDLSSRFLEREQNMVSFSSLPSVPRSICPGKLLPLVSKKPAISGLQVLKAHSWSRRGIILRSDDYSETHTWIVSKGRQDFVQINTAGSGPKPHTNQGRPQSGDVLNGLSARAFQ